MSKPMEFFVTEAHLKLLKRMYVDWNYEAYDGAPAVDIKRPYGNSDVVGDIYEIINGFEWDEEVMGEMPESTRNILLLLHRETAIALQIAMSTGVFEVGEYTRPISYDSRTWVRKLEHPKAGS